MLNNDLASRTQDLVRVFGNCNPAIIIDHPVDSIVILVSFSRRHHCCLVSGTGPPISTRISTSTTKILGQAVHGYMFEVIR